MEQNTSKENLKTAISFIKGGEKLKGRQILLDIIKSDPNNELAWMWLSTCYDSNENKFRCLEKVLEINPNNEKVKKVYEKLQSIEAEPDLESMIGDNRITITHNSENQNNLPKVLPQSIEFIPAKCPNCGGELRVPTDRTAVKCMYCGYEVIIHDPNKINVNIEYKRDISKPLKLAQTAEDAQNFEDGYKYYSIVLEEDSENVTSWLGKARCSAWRSTAISPTLEEAISYVNMALSINKNIGKDLDFSIDQISYATIKFVKLVLNYLEIEHKMNAPGAAPAPDPLLVFAVQYGRSKHQNEINKKFIDYYFPIIFRSMVFCWEKANSYIVGMNFFQTISILNKNSIITNQTSQYIDNQLYKIVNEISRKYPNLQPPQKKKDCYIATAVLGDFDHPFVKTLRDFRDLILCKNQIGKLFIKTYYQFGPHFARIIQKSPFLKNLTRKLIIKPLYYFALIQLNSVNKR